jgi:hypothetical protein
MFQERRTDEAGKQRFIYVVLPGFTNFSEDSCKFLSPAGVPVATIFESIFDPSHTCDDILEDSTGIPQFRSWKVTIRSSGLAVGCLLNPSPRRLRARNATLALI